jgi:hypothetical protein
VSDALQPYLDVIDQLTFTAVESLDINPDLLMGVPTTADWVAASGSRSGMVRLNGGRTQVYGHFATKADGTLTFTPQPVGAEDVRP